MSGRDWHRQEAEERLEPTRNPELKKSRWSEVRSGRLNTGKDPVRIVQEAG